MAKVIGIDLGTTNTVSAVMDGARPRILGTREGRQEMRSTVSLKLHRDAQTGGERREELIGHAAEDNAPLAPLDTIVSIKRLMGRGVGDPEIERVRAHYPYRIVEPADGTRDSIRVLLDGRPLSPADISAKLLRRAKDDAERACRDDVSYAVITVPAYFSEAQRAATKLAATRAGLHVVRLLDEPTAAAVAFGMDRSEQDVRTLLVYDLGGGTFDLSVLMIAGNVFAPLALQGDMWLGGDDFDQKLIELGLDELQRRHGVDGRRSQRLMAELARAARATKERLSQSETADLIVPALTGGGQTLPELSLEITRAQFESLIRPLVTRTLELAQRALEEARLSPERIDHVLLAGNSSRLPLVQREMSALFGEGKLLRSVAPKHSVALGAAIVGARVGERIICQAFDSGRVQRECGQLNRPGAERCERSGCGAPLPTADEDGLLFTASVAPFHYGAQCADDRFALFVRKGDPYPTEQPRTQIFGTTRPNQRLITVPVYGGEHLERAGANEKQGEAVALLPPGLPRGATVAITLALDAEGLFVLSARSGDGSDLHALKTQGEADARAIAILLEVEQALAQRGAPTPAAARAEQAVTRVFELLRSGDAAGALAQAEQLRGRVLERAAAGGPDARERREALIGYCERIAQRYAWVDATEMLSFAGVAAHTRTALESGPPEALETEMATLERAWRDLPQLVRRFIDCHEAIALRVRPLDWATAARLERDLEGLEQAFKGKSRRAEEWWEGFAKRLQRELERVDAQRAAQLRCVRGHDVPPGRRHCPAPGCGADVTGLVHKGGADAAAATAGD